MIVCVLEIYQDESPQVHFFDTGELRELHRNDVPIAQEFADLLENRPDIVAPYGTYGAQAKMPTVRPPCRVDKAFTLWDEG